MRYEKNHTGRLLLIDIIGMAWNNDLLDSNTPPPIFSQFSVDMDLKTQAQLFSTSGVFEGQLRKLYKIKK